MKQKTVIGIGMHCEKCRVEIMKIAVSFAGVETASVEVDKSQIEVVGDGVDVVKLTRKIRKKVGFAVIQSMADVEEKKTKEVTKEKTEVVVNPCMVWPYFAPPSIGFINPHCACDDQPFCAIL